MKILDIVDKKINYCEKQEVPFISIRLVSLQQIKQDLEILEKTYKKEVDIGYIKDLVKRFSDNNYILERYNATWDIVNHLTMEELQKLKQWLEVNE